MGPRHRAEDTAAMPIVEVTLKEGRNKQKKAELIKNVTDTVVNTLGVQPQQVRVLLHVIPGSLWGFAGKSDD
jgi:4-oxalocrotonate tautomerase